ncbi:MAG TPA: cell division protein FtsL [Nitrospiraceae bacterium]|nr:cell division protein FtsL [Nitrospiraceae bacterium]
MKIMAGLAVVSLVLLCVWERVDVVQVGYRIEQLKLKKTALERERDELRVKVSGLTSPDRIAKLATEKLGMVPPQQGQVKLVRVEPPIPTKVRPEPRHLWLAKSTP